jgi:uncharacterized membrane protein YhfC
VLYAALVAQLLIATLAPIALWVYLRKKHGVAVMLFVAGGVSFIGSQVVHIPMLIGVTKLFKVWKVIPEAWALPFNAILLGLMAGACEETARWVVYRYWQKGARDYKSAIALGAGHGGIESILLVGLGVLGVIVSLLIWQRAPQLLGTNPEVAKAMEQVANVPRYMPIVGGIERLMAITVHLSASVLVLQCFVRKNIGWLFLAILWHGALDGVAVFVNGKWGALPAEGATAVFTVGAIAILFALRERRGATEGDLTLASP